MADGPPRPPILYWRLPTGVVLASVLGPSLAPEHRLGRHVPHGAEAWQVWGGPWRPLGELPRGWGLSPRGARPVVDSEEPEEG